jgi:hypothetical protein
MRRAIWLASLLLPLIGCYGEPAGPGYGYGPPGYPPGPPPQAYDPYGGGYPGYSYNGGAPVYLDAGVAMPLVLLGGEWGYYDHGRHWHRPTVCRRVVTASSIPMVRRQVAAVTSIPTVHRAPTPFRSRGRVGLVGTRRFARQGSRSPLRRRIRHLRQRAPARRVMNADTIVRRANTADGFGSDLAAYSVVSHRKDGPLVCHYWFISMQYYTAGLLYFRLRGSGCDNGV